MESSLIQKNMEIAWNQTSKKFDLNISFNKYFKKIGMPFMEILKSLDVEPRIEIYECFKNTSLENIHLIKPYKNVTRMLDKLRKNKIKFSIVTSKDFKRTKFLLKKSGIEPNSIHCPNKKLRGKPYPDHLLHSIKMNNVEPLDSCFFGDSKIDYLAAKNANIDFVFVSYGYGKESNEYKQQIEDFNQVNKFIEI